MDIEISTTFIDLLGNIKTNKIKPIAKAWRINNANFNEPWYAPDGYYYGETCGEAKSKALSDACDYEDNMGDSFTYTSLRMTRCKEGDKYLCPDGNTYNLRDIESRGKYEQRRIDYKKLLKDNPNSYAYKKKGGYYYKPNNCGYTEYRVYAGVYTLEDAVRSSLSSSIGDFLRPIVIDIEEHNQLINDQIESLKQRLIPKTT